MKRIINHWKTSLVGLVAGMSSLMYPYLLGTEITWKNIGIAAFLAFLGFMSKDTKDGNTSKEKPKE